MNYKTICLLLAVLGLFSCSIINLSDLVIDTNLPAEDNVLSSGTEIKIKFSDSVSEDSTEQLISLTQKDDTVNLDYFWDDNRTLRVDPVKPLVPGRRYCLNIDGVVNLTDGRYFSIRKYYPFYYGTCEAVPYLVNSAPFDNGTAATDMTLVLTFSQSMDSSGFEKAFTFSPAADFSASWNSDKTSVTVTPDNPLSNLERYSWTVTGDLKSTSGIPLLADERGAFLVQADISPPAVSSAVPGDFNGGSPLVLPATLNEIGYSDGLYFTFSEAVDPSSFESAFSINPKVSGLFTIIDPTQIFFQPDHGWDQQKDYIIEIGTGLSDKSGNKLTDPVQIKFTTEQINPVGLVSIDGSGSADTTIATFNKYDPEQIYITSGITQQYRITLNLTEDYTSPASKLRLQDCINFSGFYNVASAPVISNIDWVTDHKITITYVNMEISPTINPDDRCVYRFFISGGQGSVNDSGSYFPDDLFIFMESNS